MTINKNTDLEFSLQEGTERGGVYTNFYTEDKGSASIRIRLSNNNYYLDLTKTDLKPVLFLFHEDGSIFEIKDFVNIMLDKGLIQYNLPNNVIAHSGKVNAKLFLKNTEKSVHVANFTFDIKDSGIEGVIGKEIKVELLEDIVRDVMTDNAMGLLDDSYKEKINQDVIDYVASNPDKYKGPKGDSFNYDSLTKEQKDELKSNITNQAVTDYVIPNKSISNSKLTDTFSRARILEENEDVTMVNKEGIYFKSTTTRLKNLPATIVDSGYGFSGFLIVKPFSQYHYIQELYDLNNTGVVFNRTVKNNTNTEWKSNSDDVKVQQLSNTQVNNKLQYNLNVFEKYTNEVIPEVNMKYANAIQDISIEGVEKGTPIKVWTLSRAFSTWNYRIMIGAKINGVWSTLLDTGVNFVVEENPIGATNIEFEKNGIKLKARIDYNVIPKNDRLLDHSSMTNDPYFILRQDKVGNKETTANGGGGQAYDQTLNTTDNVRFASIKADSIEVGGELKKGTLQEPPTGLVKGDMWLDTTDSSTHPILRVMS